MSATALSAGTAVGGWRIMKTMGQRVAKLELVHGFAAQATAATIILGAAHFGMPVSTTQVISGSIMGVGASQGARAVRWGVARRILGSPGGPRVVTRTSDPQAQPAFATCVARRWPPDEGGRWRPLTR